MRIIIGSGGTGGHLYPALALIQYIESQEDTQVLFVGTKDRLESQVVPKLGYQYRGLDVKGLVGSPLNKLKNIMLFVRSIKEAKKIIREFAPDIVVGFGGYPSASIVMAASQLKIPTMIHEQNSIIGLTNKILVNKVDKIIACYQGAYEKFPKGKTYLYGNPRASLVGTQATVDVHEKYGLKKDLPIVTMVMGSLGSKTINDKMVAALQKADFKDYSLVYVTGKNYYDEVCSKLEGCVENIKIVPYIDDMASLMQSSTLMVTRGGASTLAELTALGKPAIIIPSPYVVKNHQEFNALELSSNNAAKMILEADLDGTKLLERIEGLIQSPLQLEAMHQASLKLSQSDASKNIYELIKTMI